MAENTAVIGKDFRAIAMENAYYLAINAIPKNLPMEERLAHSANLTWILFDAMTRGDIAKPEDIKKYLGK